MFYILGVMFCGVGLGFLLRGRSNVKRLAERATMPVIYLLLFAMGVSVGANKNVMENLSSLGVEALIVTLGAVVGSITAALVTYKLFFRKGSR